MTDVTDAWRGVAPTRQPCSVDECGRPRAGLGLCKFHWERKKRGVPLDAAMNYRPPGRRYGKASTPAAEKVVARAGNPGECWEWSGTRTPHGYGLVDQFENGKRTRLYAHRVAYATLVGPIGDGLDLDHLCRNTSCFNPDHLEPVTHHENMMRGVGPSAINARKTRCIHGHEFTPDNTYVNPQGHRSCRSCATERQRVRRSRA